jgi:parallel beta-helix repeat protein
MLKHTLFLTVFVLFSASLFSDTLHVPGDHPTIQQAIDASANGDTVLVHPGTYVENIDFKGKAVTLVSELGPAVTIIDGNKLGSVVTFKTNETSSSVLDGFTVRNGRGDYLVPLQSHFGGGISCQESHPTIRNNIITNNEVTQTPSFISRGGGIGCYKGSPEITGNVITDNSAYAGGGGGLALVESQSEVRGNTFSKNYVNFWGAGIFCQDSLEPVIVDNTFTGNKAGNNDKSSAGYGSGIACSYSSPLIRNNILNANLTESGNGGALHLSHCDSEVTGNTITENTAYGRGGGIMCANESSPVITGNTVIDNRARFGGGGICWGYDCNPVVAENTITGNVAWEGPGGGIYFDGDQPVSNRAPAGRVGFVAHNLVAGNSAVEGGGMYFYYWGFFTVTSNLVKGNTAVERGGGVSCALTTLDFWNNTISANQAGTHGGGLCLVAYYSSLCNNTVTGNTADGVGGGIYSRLSQASAMNMILWDNSAAAGPEIAVSGDDFTIHCSDVAGGLNDVLLDAGGVIHWGSGMIDADPLFVDPVNGDYHLRHPSPCLDQGDNACVTMPHDFEEDPRISGGVVDMGMDEFHTHLYCTGDATPGGAIQGKLVGDPGTSPVGLFIGSSIAPSGIPTAWGWFHLEWPYVLIGPLEAIPSSGVLVLPAVLPGSPPAPYDVPMQALIGLNPNSLSNLFVLEVR